MSLRGALRYWARSPRPAHRTLLSDPVTGRQVLWIPLKSLAKLIGRCYMAVLNYTRTGWITSMNVGDRTTWLCMVPKRRALAEYRALRCRGLVR